MVYHILILIIVGALGVLFYRKWTKRPLLLPKPPGLPLVGNTFQLDESGPHKTLTEWSEKYGPVYAINLCGKDIVILSSYEAIHEAAVLKGNDFSGRPKSFLYEVNITKTESITYFLGYYYHRLVHSNHSSNIPLDNDPCMEMNRCALPAKGNGHVTALYAQPLLFTM